MQVLERNLRTDASAAPIYDVGGVFALIGSTGGGQNHHGGQTGRPVRPTTRGAKRWPDHAGYLPGRCPRATALYGRMLGVVAHLAHDKAALKDLLGLLSGKKMVIIDTTGVSPRPPQGRYFASAAAAWRAATAGGQCRLPHGAILG